VLYLARTLLDRPRAELPPLPAPKARKFRRLLRWDVAFVLVQPLTPETQCGHGRDPATDDEKAPCSEGVRLQLTALLAPSPRAERRYSQTITCEQHAVEALFWLKKHHRKWTAATTKNRMTTREFDLSDILSVTTGRLVSSRHIAGVYDILNFLTGANLLTHQLPRACRLCAPAILQQHPALADSALQTATETYCDSLAGLSDEEAQLRIAAFVAAQQALYGVTLPLTALETEADFTDPVQDLREMIGPEKPILVIAPKEVPL
jgi:hypothetical protein